MKYYLILLLIVIMGAGAKIMFDLAYMGLAVEHDASPNAQTGLLMFMILWYILMMVADILLLTTKNLKFKNTLVALFTIGVISPIIYILFIGR